MIKIFFIVLRIWYKNFIGDHLVLFIKQLIIYIRVGSEHVRARRLLLVRAAIPAWTRLEYNFLFYLARHRALGVDGAQSHALNWLDYKQLAV